MPRLRDDAARGNTPALAPPRGAAKAAARCQTHLRPALPWGEDSDSRSNPKTTSRPYQMDPIGFDLRCPKRLGWNRQVPWSRTVENAEPPVFSIFFDPSSLSDGPLLSTTADAQIPAEADVSAAMPKPRRPRAPALPTPGNALLPSLRGDATGSYGINALVRFSACRVPLRDAILPVSCCNFDASVGGSPPR
jgi:hypothetical protein